jgi:hypothetical protein
VGPPRDSYDSCDVGEKVEYDRGDGADAAPRSENDAWTLLNVSTAECAWRGPCSGLARAMTGLDGTAPIGLGVAMTRREGPAPDDENVESAGSKSVARDASDIVDFVRLPKLLFSVLLLYRGGKKLIVDMVDAFDMIRL